MTMDDSQPTDPPAEPPDSQAASTARRVTRDTDGPDTDESPEVHSSKAPTIEAPGPSPERDSGANTMLSVPQPADRYETDLEERVLRAEREITRLTARVEVLENRKPLRVVERTEQAAGSMRTLVLWVIALSLLVGFWLAFGRVPE